MLHRLLYFFILLLIFCFDLKAEDVNTFQWNSLNRLACETDSVQFLPLDEWKISPDGNKIMAPFCIADRERIELSTDFFLPASGKSKDIYLNSMGFSSSAKLILNDIELQGRPNDNTPFKLKLPNSILNYNQENSLRLILYSTNSTSEGYPEFTRLFTAAKYIGITRPLAIAVQSKKRIEDFGCKTSFERKQPKVDFEYSIKLPDIKPDARIDVEERILSADLKLVYQKNYFFTGLTDKIKRTFNLNPEDLWAPGNPNLCIVSITVKDKKNILIQKTVKTGFRTLNVRNGAVLLNNKTEMVRGIIYHPDPLQFSGQDYPKKIMEDFNWIKNSGFNAVRLPRAMPDIPMLTAADSLGILLFPELPIHRYPSVMFSDDNLLELAKSSLRNVKENIISHPSLAAVGIGKELHLEKGATQKFMLILRDFINRELNLISFLSPVPGIVLPPRKAADLYILDIYRSLQQETNNTHSHFAAYNLFGQISLLKKFGMDEAIIDPEMKYLKQEVQTALLRYKFNGGFIESFRDWHSSFPTSLTISAENKAMIIPSGFFDKLGQSKADWQKLDKIWENSQTQYIIKQEEKSQNNIFSIITVFAAIIFFAVYRKRPRMRENFWRSLNHPYGFFVDMRERRIIPIFNSFMIGSFASLILAVIFASFIYSQKNSIALQEILNIFLAPSGYYESYLALSNNPLYLILFHFIVLLLYPIVISMILKLISFLNSRKIRYRQALAIGLWSGLPLILLLPLGLVCYHLLIQYDIAGYIYIIVLFFIIWAHFRIINGIRVLLVTNLLKVFIMLLLSYIIPFIIFWFVLKPAPFLMEYIGLIINSSSMF